MSSWAQQYQLADILEDIYGQLAEYGIAMDDVAEQLMEIAEHPIDLNQTNAEELSQLCWLTDEQIDDILLYQYQHAFVSVYDLQLIHSLKDYDGIDVKRHEGLIFVRSPRKFDEQTLIRQISKVFGVASISPAVEAPSDLDAIGEEAAKKLIDLIEKPKTTIIEQIIIGGEVYEGKTVRKL
jgi:hypothetical protein